ncbi:hypothetical protein HYPBUDRAFT_152878 [Hyphopichia burtonii NRRL Y-1933]|uniref:C3H1-type domain-containing protein n=1 Tax=Hyphopichia burtonii NRRL Y-1933 TaxID=984485 RepID=A0A1E4RHS4_9ASCO|nr:hypothetical protein HYPBUDRAFT_152878 [Hyphopichia burtonii NRRL Y-1933]ODV66827.1 hypothetical protein HYPBUDRAFT_152878 [Hyphopichia burtonii NRRL Y-1933]
MNSNEWLLDGLPTHLPNEEAETPEPRPQPKPESDPSDDEQVTLIPGTNISLQTDEDIAKWIEERKKKWPTNRRVQEKQQQQQLLLPAKRLAADDQPKKKQKTVCRFYQQHKRCKFGNQCSFVHETQQSKPSSGSTKMLNGIEINVPKRFTNEMYVNPATNSSLYKMLVQRDLYLNQNEIVLDFIEYLYDKGLIDENVNL